MGADFFGRYDIRFDIIKCDAAHLDELLVLAKQTFIEAFEKVSDPENFKLYVANTFTPSVLGVFPSPQSCQASILLQICIPRIYD